MATTVILHEPPQDDALIEIDLPPDAGIGHTFHHSGREWTITANQEAGETEPNAWVAAPRPHNDPPTATVGPPDAA